MSGKIDRLVGDDGLVVMGGELGAELVGDGTKTFDVLVPAGGKGIYVITAKASSASLFDELEVGDPWYDPGDGVMAVGDKVKAFPLSQTPATSVKGWKLDESRSKIDVTTMVDVNDTFRMGKISVSGSLSMITTISQQLIQSKFIRFVDIDHSAATPTGTVTDPNSDPVYLLLFAQGKEIAGESLLVVVGKVEIENASLAAQKGSAQEFEAAFAPAAGEQFRLMRVKLAAA